MNAFRLAGRTTKYSTPEEIHRDLVKVFEFYDCKRKHLGYQL